MSDVTVITGTRKGIGRELSEYYLMKGHIVVGCSRGNASIEHERYAHYELDVADEKAVVHMIKDAKKKHGRIDNLLNNAGIASMNHILATPYKTAISIFSTNFLGVFLFVRESAKVMMTQKYGRIVNFATVASPLRLEGEALYSASKAAVVNFTEIAARELAQFGITVNAVGPTPVLTDLIRNVQKEKLDALLERQAIRRFGETRDISHIIDFFIDRKSDFVTGQVVYLGGVHY